MDRLPQFLNETIKINKSLPVMKPYYDLIHQVRNAYGLVFEKPSLDYDKRLVDAFLAEGMRTIKDYDVETLFGLIYIMDRGVAFPYSDRFDDGEFSEDELFSREKEIISYSGAKLTILLENLCQEKDYGLVLRNCSIVPDIDGKLHSNGQLQHFRHLLIGQKR
jgi:hypothetical protein